MIPQLPNSVRFWADTLTVEMEDEEVERCGISNHEDGD